MANPDITLEVMEEHIRQEEWNDAAAILEQTDVQRLPWNQREKAIRLFSLLPEELRLTRPLLCARRIQLAAGLGDREQMRKGFAALTFVREHSRENTHERQKVENLLSTACLLKRGTDNAQMLLTLSVLYNELHGAVPQLVFSATGGRPSVLNGAKDLSQWGRNWRAVSSIVRPMLGALLPFGGEGAAAAACAELLYLKNDINNAALQVVGAKNAPDPEIRFAGLALTVWLHRLDPAAKPPEELAERLLATLEKEDASWLIPNAEALITRLDISRGRVEKAEQWAARYEGAELDHCCPDNAYVLQTKAQVYLALGRFREAAMLTEELLHMIEGDCRPIDRIEYLLDGALACERMGDAATALDKVRQALTLAYPYGYVRLFADRGAPMLSLLDRCAKECDLPEEQISFWRKCVEAARQMSLHCPALYAPVAKEENTTELTRTEVQVLHLLAQGKTNRDICESMGFKLPTAKFHIHNLCDKLGVANRTAAVAEAQKQGIL